MEIECIIQALRSHPKIRTKTRIAEVCGVSLQSLNTWTRVPAEYVLDLEAACDGAVTRYEMRPDVFRSSPNDDRMLDTG